MFASSSQPVFVYNIYFAEGLAEEEEEEVLMAPPGVALFLSDSL